MLWPSVLPMSILLVNSTNCEVHNVCVLLTNDFLKPKATDVNYYFTPPTTSSLLTRRLSYSNFILGLSFVDLLTLASRLTVLNASYSAKQWTIQCFDQEDKRYQERRAKGVALSAKSGLSLSLSEICRL